MTRLTVKRLFDDPPLLGPAPNQVKIGPGGTWVTFLRVADDDRERRDLWSYEVATGRIQEWVNAAAFTTEVDALTVDEKALRERRRSFATGVTAYQWHPDGQNILLNLDGGAHMYAIANQALSALTPPGTRQTGIGLSTTGRYLSFVRTGDLYLHDLELGTERRLTNDASDTVTNGLPEFVAQEEMLRLQGYWWSHDDRYLAFTRVDEGCIPQSHRHEINADGIDVVTQRYPYAGADNAEVRLGLLEVATGEVEWLAWGDADHAYLARLHFTPSRKLIVEAQTRAQQRLDVRMYDPVAKTWSTLIRETSATWINLHDNLTFTGDGDTFLWTSERGGSADIYRYDCHQSSLERMPSGLGRVNRIVAATADSVIVTGWLADPTTQHVYRVGLAGASNPQALTGGDAWHDCEIDRAGAICVVTRTDPDTPLRIDLIDLTTRASQPIHDGRLDATHPYFEFLDEHVPAQFGHIEASDGQALYYRLTPPSQLDPGTKYPVVIHVYGGPGAQRVRRAWAPLSVQLFAQRGFGVFELDNRGGANRAKRFEDPVYRVLGDVEVRDQRAGVEFLRGLSWVDSDRIGIFGGSYGGFMTLMCLAKAPDVFAAGASVSPVSDWTLYDTHYTERYLSTPSANADGYRASSVFEHLDTLRAPLLLMHGMADDNVLFTHTTKLMQAMQDRGIAFELMTYPGAKHSMQEPTVATHRYTMILDFFERHLKT